MAKLSARGRTEIYRVEQPLSQEAAFSGGVKPTRKVLMSDGKVLFNYGYGWKIAGQLQAMRTPKEWLEDKLAKGWKRI